MKFSDKVKFYLAAFPCAPMLFKHHFFPAKTAETKGLFAEKFVGTILKTVLGREFHIIKNVILSIENDTTEIDSLIVSKYGVFVIEIKLRNGKIYGQEKEKNWTQHFSRNVNQSFQNPLRQNYKHIKAIETITGIPEKHLHSLVIFICSKKLPEFTNVQRPWGTIEYIRTFEKQVFNDDEVSGIIDIIEDHQLNHSTENINLHIENVQAIIENKKTRRVEPKTAPTPPPPPVIQATTEQTIPTCPRCGAPMELRTTQTPFWGCSTFGQKLCRGKRDPKTLEPITKK